MDNDMVTDADKKKNKNNMDKEQKVPSGHLTCIKFSILSGADIERSSVMSIDIASDLSNPKLGLPNLSSECSTCGGRDMRKCDGHPGRINFYRDIVHPHFIPETVQILNKICPGCKHLKEDFGIRKLLESTERKMIADRTISLFLSKKLGKWLYGYEYGALKVESHLKRVLFDDVVCNVIIFFTPQSSPGMGTSPWISHFRVCKERMRRRGLNVQSIIEALSQEYNLIAGKPKSGLPKLQILSRHCSVCKEDKEDEETLCITVAA